MPTMLNACHCPHSPTPVCVLHDLCVSVANQGWTTAAIGIATTNETNPQICALDHPPKWQSSDHWSCSWFQAPHWRNSLWFYIFSSGTHYMWRWSVSSDFSKLADGGWYLPSTANAMQSNSVCDYIHTATVFCLVEGVVWLWWQYCRGLGQGMSTFKLHEKYFGEWVMYWFIERPNASVAILKSNTCFKVCG